MINEWTISILVCNVILWFMDGRKALVNCKLTLHFCSIIIFFFTKNSNFILTKHTDVR